MNEEKTYSVGVVLGRFQLSELHEAHSRLIQTACDNHGKVIVFLGNAELRSTINNPLDFEARKQMILEKFPNVDIHYIKNQRSDIEWSHNLDRMISDLLTPSQNAILYGGRDSFIEHYHGRYDCHELEQDVYISATEQRKKIRDSSTRSSPDYRAGVIWATGDRYPTVYSTVDVALFKDDSTGNFRPFQNLVLGHKKTDPEGTWRFFGGFADVNSPNDEADARREVMEEANVEITDPEPIGNFLIDDWRYRGEVDCIRTHFFHAKIFTGRLTPKDDLEGGLIKVFQINELPTIQFVPEHKVLQDALINYLETKQGIVFVPGADDAH